MMEQSLNIQFVMMRAKAEMKAAHSDRLGQEHVFLGLLKLAEMKAENAYNAYMESWVENDTEHAYLILEKEDGAPSPFTEVFGEEAQWSVALHRERGPNMRVVYCKEFVSLREERSASSRRLAKVPLGAAVLAFPEAGKENGFILCVYHDEYGYILSEYLEKIE